MSVRYRTEECLPRGYFLAPEVSFPTLNSRAARNLSIKGMPVSFAATPSGRPRLLVSGFFRKEGAPALRADLSIDSFAGARRLEKVTPITALCTFRLILVRDCVLRHLGLCDRKIRPEASNDRSTNPIGRHAPEKNTP
jgi:hypothetical protein